MGKSLIIKCNIDGDIIMTFLLMGEISYIECHVYDLMLEKFSGVMMVLLIATAASSLVAISSMIYKPAYAPEPAVLVANPSSPSSTAAAPGTPPPASTNDPWTKPMTVMPSHVFYEWNKHEL